MGTQRGTYGPGEFVERLPVVQGAIFGSIAHVAGLVATYLVLTLDDEFEFGASGAPGVGTVDELGWLFFGSHFARVQRSGAFGSRGEGERVNLVAETAFQVPKPLLYLVPAALLIGAGAALVSETELWESSLKAYAATGATVVVGYFPLSALGLFAFETRIGVGESAFVQSPELSTTILFVGLAYPLCFGAVGGVISLLVAGARGG